MKPKIFVVDDEAGVRESLQQMLSRDFFVISADCARKAKGIFKRESFDVVLLDILLPDSSGIALLKEFRKEHPDVPVIMITGMRQVKTAVEAMKLGAHDYLTKPFTMDELNTALTGAIHSKMRENEASRLFKQSQEEVFFGSILGRSPKMLEVFKRIAQVMHTSTTVLIQGESGTGKELIAKAIHYHGVRREKPFIPIHIASLSENLLESELFGHEKGAFTGALNTKKGTLEMADGGTVFLDEIGDISPGIQVKLLRFLQEREFRRVGGTKDIKIDVRIITATNKDLWHLVERGEFREDLYYRVSVVPIYVPGLRERLEDIPVLVYHLISKFKKDINTKVKGFTKDSMELLKKYNWPGNVRELENLIEQLLLTVNNQWILPEDIPIYIHRNNMAYQKYTLEGTISEHERRIIEETLEKTNGVIVKAAEMLGTTRRVLKYKIDKLGIPLYR